MYDWILKYGENQKNEMRSGYEYVTEEWAKKKGEEFIVKANKNFVHYPNPKIEIICLN